MICSVMLNVKFFCLKPIKSERRGPEFTRTRRAKKIHDCRIYKVRFSYIFLRIDNMEKFTYPKFI